MCLSWDGMGWDGIFSPSSFFFLPVEEGMTFFSLLSDELRLDFMSDEGVEF